MRQPTLAQRLEAAPAVVRAQRHGEHVAEFAVEVRQVALRMADGGELHIEQPPQALGQQTRPPECSGIQTTTV